MGTGMIIQSATALDDGFRSKLDAFIDGYESVLSIISVPSTGARHGATMWSVMAQRW